MPAKHRRSTHEYELVPRDSLDDEAKDHPEFEVITAKPSWLTRLGHWLRITRFPDRAAYAHYVTPRRRKRSILRLIYWTIFSIPYFLVSLVLIASIFFPSYTVRPAHYTELRQRTLDTNQPGRGNPHGEKVFIAAALYEEKGHLTSGAWGSAVLQLIDLLGPDNVYLSIYEDNPDLKTKQSLVEFRGKITSECLHPARECMPPADATGNATIIFEDLDYSSLPHTKLPNGEERLKRIAFLAEVRNRALAPIDAAGVTYDKILFLNDIIFDPVEAAQLLFATNVDSTGRANYAAACAVDFINAFKFYDRFATVGFDADFTGIPFFPWFTTTGGTSRKDVISQTDAVRVRSCWSGMVAYEARWFQDQSHDRNKTAASTDLRTAPIRFRYDEFVWWESSECCLVNADLQYRESGQGLPADPRIYMNPYVRVAYDEYTLSWLALTRRPELLYSWIHDILNKMVGFPLATNRVGEEIGSKQTDTWWEYDNWTAGLASNATNEDFKGHWTQVDRVSEPGGWCGGENLLVINEKPEHGEGKWSKIWPPHPPSA